MSHLFDSVKEALGLDAPQPQVLQSSMTPEQDTHGNAWAQSQAFFGQEEPLKAKAGLGPVIEEIVADIDTRQKMAQNYNIVDDPSQKKNPNDLTAEEFEEITDRVNQIRRGETALKIDPSEAPDPDAFKAQQMGDIMEMMKTESGRKLVMDLSDAEKTKGHVTTLKWEYNASSATATDKKSSHDGTGTDSTVKLSRTGDKVQEDFDGPGKDFTQTTDTVLFHEMVHAWHQTQGTDARYENDGEHHHGEYAHENDKHLCRSENQATGLKGFDGDRTENAYREERRRLAEAEGNEADVARYGERSHYSDLPGTPGGGPGSRADRGDEDCSEYWMKH